MPYREFSLPEYPVTEDMWDALVKEKRPIVVYGMGNGADKLFDRLAKYGLTPADVFASDGFVRGHSFRGMRVKSFSEIKQTYPDFVILLSFASNRSDVLDLIKSVNDSYDMYIPDMPVAGEKYFDREFYNEHYDEISKAYNAFDDEESKNAFSAIINYKIYGRMEYLLGCYSSLDEMYALISRKKITHMTDVGAYNGDTVKQGIRYFDSLESVLAIEPDPKNFKKLEKFGQSVDLDLILMNCAIWSESAEGAFASGGNRNSSIDSTTSYEHKYTQVRLLRLDDVMPATDYIKYDVEGAEKEGLLGSMQTIRKFSPALLVSLYHRSEDIFSLVNYLREELPTYRFYLRRLMCVPAWEINLILLPNDL